MTRIQFRKRVQAAKDEELLRLLRLYQHSEALVGMIEREQLRRLNRHETQLLSQWTT